MNSIETTGNAETGTLIFSIVFFIIIGGCWLWVWFMDGAQTWSDSLIKTKSNVYGISYKHGSPLVKPAVLKTVITILLLCAAGLVIRVITKAG